MFLTHDNEKGNKIEKEHFGFAHWDLLIRMIEQWRRRGQMGLLQTVVRWGQADLVNDLLSKNELVKRAEKFQKDLEKDLQKNEYVKRARKFRKDANKRFESSVDDLLGTFQIATASDVKKLDRKLSQISKKLKEIEAARASQPAAPTQTLQ